jgi:hypothetical protein
MDPTTQRLMMSASTGAEGTQWVDRGFAIRTDLGNTGAFNDNYTMHSVIYANNLVTPLLIAVGNAGTIVTSTDGITWTLVNGINVDSGIRGIAYNSASNILIASGGAGAYYRSTDGLNWTTYSYGIVNYYGCRFLNNQFWMVGDFGSVVYSTTGMPGTWATATVPAGHSTYRIKDIAYGTTSGTARYIYCGEGGIVGTSTSGTTFTAVRNYQTAFWESNSIAYISSYSTTGQFLIAGAREVSAAQVGTLWRTTAATPSLAIVAGAVSATNVQFDYVYYDVSLPSPNRYILGTFFETYISADSVTWTQRTSAPNAINNVVYNTGDSKIYFVGETAGNSITFTSVFTYSGFIASADNTFSTFTPIKTGAVFNGVAYSSSLNKFVAIGSDETAASSTNGTTWTLYYPYASTGGGPLSFNCITALGSGANKFVAGTSSEEYYSSDGVTWTAATSSTVTGGLTGIAYSSTYGLVGVVGTSSTTSIYRSIDDGVNWTTINTGLTAAKFYSIAYTSGQGYFAVGATTGNVTHIRLSTNGVTWTAGNTTGITSYKPQSCTIQPSSGTYIAVTTLGRVLSTTSPSTASWVTTPELGVSSSWNASSAYATPRATIVITDAIGEIFTNKAVAGLTSRTSGVTSGLYATTSSATRIVTVGANGTILTSP